MKPRRRTDAPETSTAPGLDANSGSPEDMCKPTRQSSRAQLTPEPRQARDGAAETESAASPPAVPIVHAAADNTCTYYDHTHRIAAVIGPAAAIRVRWRQGYRDFDIYRDPDGGRFMLLRFDLGIESLGQAIAATPPLNGAGWTQITVADLQRLVDGNDAPTS